MPQEPVSPDPPPDDPPPSVPADHPAFGSPEWRPVPCSPDWPEWMSDEGYLAAVDASTGPVAVAGLPRPPGSVPFRFTPSGRGPSGGYGTWTLSVPGRPDLQVTLES